MTKKITRREFIESSAAAAALGLALPSSADAQRRRGVRAGRRGGPRRLSSYDREVRRTLSQMTGGRVFFVEDIKQLAGIYNQIADEFANQYTIGYTSKNVKRDGAWRAIAVRVNRASTSAWTKSGYYGPSKER